MPLNVSESFLDDPIQVHRSLRRYRRRPACSDRQADRDAGSEFKPPQQVPTKSAGEILLDPGQSPKVVHELADVDEGITARVLDLHDLTRDIVSASLVPSQNLS